MRIPRVNFFLLTTMMLATAHPLPAQDNLPPGDNYRNEAPEQRAARMAWWRGAKIGVFYRWGLFAIPGGKYAGKPVTGSPEWILHNAKIPLAEYKQFAKQFTAASYNPEIWATLAKDTGARYLVMSAKDLDGFALFDSAATDWDAKGAACAKDLLKPMADAAHKAGLKMGLHYCQSHDWVHPGGGIRDDKSWDLAQNGDFDAFFQKITMPQVKELMSNYGPIAVMWWNESIKIKKEQSVALIGLMAGAQPGIIMNSRVGHYRGDFYSLGWPIPPYPLNHDWEYSTGLSETPALIQRMAEAICKGGNFLLIVYPDGQGSISQTNADRMRGLGAWLKTNAEAVYDTTPSPVSFQSWGGCTQRPRQGGSTLYLHVLKWPAGGKLNVLGLRSAPTAASILLSGEKLASELGPDGVVVTIPAAPPDAANTVIKLEIDGELFADKPLPTPDDKGQITLEAPDAAITRGIPGEGIRFEFRDNHLNLGGWENPADWVSWRFMTKEPGNFKIEALMASEKESAFRIDIAEESMFPVVPGGGDSGKFKKVELGEIKIPNAGYNELTLKPIGQTWKPINLRRLIITQAK